MIAMSPIASLDIGDMLLSQQYMSILLNNEIVLAKIVFIINS